MTSTLLKASSALPLNAPTLHRLSNGLTIVAEQMPVEAVNLNLWLNVGSAKEPDDINGMAHFLEHMIFKGTSQLESGEFERLIEARGAVTNAATSQDYTHYYITSAPKDFADLAPLQIEVLLNASIPDQSFERERLVVLEEIRRSEDNPRRRTFQRTTETTFEQLPYRRPVLGPTQVIEQLVPQQMRDFHAAWYQPSQMTAAVVGNLPVEQMIEILEHGFAQAESHRSPGVESGNYISKHLPTLHPEQPFQEIVRREFVDPTLQQARLVMTWRVPGLMDLDQTYALDVLASILGHGRTARLVQDLREEKGLVTQISASNMTYQHQGVFSVSARLSIEHLPAVEATIVQHITRMQTEPVSASEIARVRTQVANHFIFGNETPSDRSGLYGYYHSLVGDLAPALNYPIHIRSLSEETLQAAAQKYLSPNAYGIIVMKPEQSH
ncbi:MAG: insulinase family protein [Scytolyngbya sp. HA4215-MV1]|jgi:predicted Zn-dependent peptidase|nr:insulinase family protein [Scytolyngbya sp. HA4215-MV1]